MKWLRISLLAAGTLLALPPLLGVWLPDVITASEHALAEARLAMRRAADPEGHSPKLPQIQESHR